MNNPSFNIAELSNHLARKWKTILLITCITTAAAGVFSLLVKPEYTAATKLLPGNTVLADKARLMNPSIQHLYSFFGNGDDVERLISMAGTDTILKQVALAFKLSNYYQIDEKDTKLSQFKTLEKFKKDIWIGKSVNNEMIIRCTYKDRDTAAAIANNIASQTGNALQEIWKNMYRQISIQLDSNIQQLNKQYLQNLEETNKDERLLQSESTALLKQLNTFNELKIETDLAASAPPAAIIVVEQASSPAKKSWPDLAVILPLAALSGMLFSIVLILVSAKPRTL
ncbi:Wzz/FepE/Etk N-terminal domain-containing protein [Sediminibacterium sp. TEGAF015]|uniref:Wzz/FepE/Etk N-terminal domain-containing protein n=1 Tax=Sediminibacterium sp. TEGAF015 TaxID=575378 RepID=UPI002200A0F6|nr:Wzz/FepE/Etk N-terminal domain-containing protein [Sediminibacterium sp. TEGAF015]BDQ12445.1 hypothetical protein TEGAF0_16620 [Sediminibacterium sp. TEGAF015]